MKRIIFIDSRKRWKCSAQTEGVHLVVGRVPVGAEPLEHVGRVEHGGAVDGQDRLRRGTSLPFIQMFSSFI